MARTKPIPVYWDSCVFIDAIEPNVKPDRHAILKQIIDEAKDGKIILVSSLLVLAEVRVLAGSSETVIRQTELIRDFFENDYIVLRPFDNATALRAACIGRDHNVKPYDSVHLATALQAGCKIFHTYDGDCKTKPNKGKLLKLDKKIGGSSPLRIMEPSPLSSHRFLPIRNAKTYMPRSIPACRLPQNFFRYSLTPSPN